MAWVALILVAIATIACWGLWYMIAGFVRPAWGKGDVRKYPKVDVKGGVYYGLRPHRGETPVEWTYDSNGYAPRKRRKIWWW